MLEDTVKTIKGLCKERPSIRSISFDLLHEIITVKCRQHMMSFTFNECVKCVEYIEQQV